MNTSSTSMDYSISGETAESEKAGMFVIKERLGLKMTNQRKLHLGMFLAGTGGNMASWRHPNAVVDAAINLDYYIDLTQKAESAKLDFVFFGDGLYISEKSHPNFLNRFNPLRCWRRWP